MPIAKYDMEKAFSSVRKNKFSRWGKGKTSDEPGENPDFASRRVGNGLINIGHDEEQLFGRDSTFFTVGSCFAREIESALIREGISVSSRPDLFFTSDLLSVNGRPEFGILNRFNSASMLLDIQYILDGRHHLPDTALIVENVDGTFFDAHYHPIAPLDSIGHILERRLLLWEHSQIARNADGWIFTLGLNEACFDCKAGLYRNAHPTARELKNKDALEIHVLSFNENMENMEKIHKQVMASGNGDKKIFVTVSPVPLETTYQPLDIIVANDAAKACLRNVAYEFSSSFSNVQYFPSYEIATRSALTSAFKGDLRHIRKECVQHITRQFIASHIGKMTTGP